MRRVFGIIPAHLESTRLARKLLRPICGHPMLLWVFRRARQASRLERLVVATDSEEILDVCRRHNMPAAMTSGAHRSGSDRIFEVLERGLLPAEAGDICVNIQGDEPMIRAEHIDLLVKPFDESTGRDVQVSTLKVAMSREHAANPNNVKVVTDAAGYALYFSRAMIPHPAGQAARPAYFKHLGLYAYTAAALSRFHALQPSPLELSERLEQLRFLENGVPIAVVETPEDTIGVDTEEDLRAVEEYFRRAGVRLPE